LDSTTKILAELGVQPGSVYGRLTDKQLYSAIIDHQLDLFTDIVEEIARSLIANHIALVAGDALEGYNPGHDICRVITNAAIKLAGQGGECKIASYDFPLTGQPVACPDDLKQDAIFLDLDQQTFDCKIATARRYKEIFSDIDQAFKDEGEEAFRRECLRPVTACDAPLIEPPFYERYGERQVAAGFYDRVLRYREHFLPLARAISDHAERKC
ncbi:MAG TPA: hypothetical protein VID27_07760, partial [Blastocatellia bacterium]